MEEVYGRRMKRWNMGDELEAMGRGGDIDYNTQHDASERRHRETTDKGASRAANRGEGREGRTL